MTVLPFTLLRPRNVSPALFAAAVVTFLIAVAFVPPAQLWPNVLQLGWFITGLALSAPFFLAIHDLSGARWHEPLRPIAESVAKLLPAGSALVLLAILFGNLHPVAAGGSFRALWSARLFLLARSFVYIGLWLLLSRAVMRRRFAAAYVVVFGFTVWLASVDWIMALDGAWASTIFGVYHFAGLFTAGIALMAMIAVSRGLETEVLHDLGKLLFGFSTFWMYIWFSQYMLIWYGNMPEESGYFAERLRGNWGVLFVINVLLNWVVPFVLLLPQTTKRNRAILFRVAAIVLIGHWLDLYLSIFPARLTAPVLGIGEVLAAAAALLLVRSCFVTARRATVGYSPPSIRPRSSGVG